jgi:flagellar protein FliJ
VMSKFIFRLSTLLRLREHTRDERRAALAEAYRIDEMLCRHIERIRSDLDRLRGDCRATAAPGQVNVDHLVAAERYEVALRSQQTQLERQRETVAAEIDRRRQSLIEADREVRALEKLRDKLAEEHCHEQERRDALRLDEVGQQQAMREVAP